MFEKSYFTKTGQLWKMRLAVALLFASGICFILGRFLVSRNGDAEPALLLAATAVGLGTFLWLCLSVNCPNCKTRLFWKLVSTKAANAYLLELMSLDRCPVCNHKTGDTQCLVNKKSANAGWVALAVLGPVAAYFQFKEYFNTGCVSFPEGGVFCGKSVIYGLGLFGVWCLAFPVIYFWKARSKR